MNDGQHRDKKNKRPLTSCAALSFASRCHGGRCGCFPNRCRWRFFQWSRTDLPFACTGPIPINSLWTAKARNESRPAGGVSPPSTVTTSGPTLKMANGCGCSTPETKDRGSFTENFDANLTRRAGGGGVPPPVFFFFFCFFFFFFFLSRVTRPSSQKPKRPGGRTPAARPNDA